MRSTRSLASVFLALTFTTALGCSSSDSGGGAGGAAGAPATGGGGPVSGPADAHCKADDGGRVVQPTSQAACMPDADAGAEDAMDMGDAIDMHDGMDMHDDDGGGAGGDFGETMFNAEGADDDCKYDLRFSVTPIQENQAATFTLTVTKREDGSPLTGAAPDLDVFLPPSHVAPALGDEATETAPGQYTIPGVKFDQPGRWTVRFHLWDSCLDGPESPHGHAAFFVDVP